MTTPKAHHKEIDTAEHLVRKAIQKNSLRADALDQFKNIQTTYDYKNNLPLYFNRQAFFLRRSFGQNLPLRDLFSIEGTNGVQPLFPNQIANTKFKRPGTHHKQLSLPHDKITLEVMQRLEEQKPLDFFVVENTPQIKKGKIELPTDGKDLPPEKRLKIALLEKLDEAELHRLYKVYANELLVEKFKTFRQSDSQKKLKVRTFFTALHKEKDPPPSGPKLLRLGDGDAEKNEILETRVKTMLQKRAKSLERKVIEHMIEKKQLTPKNLLGIDDDALTGRSAGFRSHRQLKVYESDDIAKAQEEVIKALKELRDFKKESNLQNAAGLTQYSKEAQKNNLFDHGSQQKMISARKDFDTQKASEKKKPSKFGSPKSKHKTRKELEQLAEDMVFAQSKLKEQIQDGAQPTGPTGFVSPLITEVPIPTAETMYPDKIEMGKLQLDLRDSIRTATESTVSFSPGRTTMGAYTARSSFRPTIKLFSDSPMNSKFGKEFDRVKKNAETTKNVIKSYNHFVGTVIEVSDFYNHESNQLKAQLEKVEDHLDEKFNEMREARESPGGIEDLAPKGELTSYREHKNFKDKLTGQIIERIKNKDVFINVLEGKKREAKFKQQMAQFVTNLNRMAGVK